MKILVPVKRVLDPALKPDIDGNRLDAGNLKHVINPFDEVALEEALRLREKGLAREIVVVGVCDQSKPEALRSALALGADRAVCVHAEAELESLAVAKILERVATRENADLILLGKQSSDTDMGAVGGILAARLDWPQATQAFEIEPIDDDTLKVSRESDVGIEESVVSLPCLISVDLRLNAPRFATLPNIMRSRKKPIEILQIDALDVDATPRLQTIEFSAPAPKQGAKMLSSVEEFLSVLRQEAEKL